MRSRLTAASASQVQVILPPEPPEWLGFRHMPPHLVNFLFLVQTGFRHVGQAGLKLFISGGPPASASHSAGISGVSHCARQICLLKFIFGQSAWLMPVIPALWGGDGGRIT